MSAIAEESLSETTKEAADVLAAQLASGVDGGSDHLRPYAAFTKDFKLRYGTGLGRVIDRRTLYMTGDHYRGLYAKVQGGVVEMGSTDSKSKEIQNREGNDIYRLNADSKEDYLPYHFNVFKEKYEHLTGLQFT